MGMMVYLFLRMNEHQQRLVKTLIETNQSLLNQVRATDLAALSGLEGITNGEKINYEKYVSTDDRELSAYLDSISTVGIGDELTQEDLETFRNGL